jgi:RsiW-degrading membrane proteinase PrsW (M82 family)
VISSFVPDAGLLGVLEIFTDPSLFIPYALIQAAVFLLLIRFLDLYEREPLSLLVAMFVWGAIGAIALAFVGNEAIDAALPPDIGIVFGAAISAPLVEELSKGLALLAAFGMSYWIARRFGGLEFEGVTDGIVYGAAVGLGFAFTENILYLFDYGFAGGITRGLDVYLLRVDFFGLQNLGHAVYTGTFGAGLGAATWARSRGARLGYPLLGLAGAMTMHAIHNGLAPLFFVSRFGLQTTAAAFAEQPLPRGPHSAHEPDGRARRHDQSCPRLRVHPRFRGYRGHLASIPAQSHQVRTCGGGERRPDYSRRMECPSALLAEGPLVLGPRSERASRALAAPSPSAQRVG